MLAGEQAAGKRAPDEHAETLIDGDRQKLVFGFAGLERVMDLLADKTLAMLSRADAERLHDMPAGKIGAADIAHLAMAHEHIKRFHGFFQRCETIPFVQLIEVDDIGLQPLQARLAGAHQMMARRSGIVWPFAHREAGLGCKQHALAALADDLTDDFLGDTLRINIRRIDQVDAGIQRHIDELAGFSNAEVADGLGPALAAKGHGADGQCRNLKAGAAEKTIVHGDVPICLTCKAQAKLVAVLRNGRGGLLTTP